MNTGRKGPLQAQAQQHKANQQPIRSHRPAIVQPKAAAPQVKKTPAAPPVYRPQITPKVLQKKADPLRAPEVKPAARKPVAMPIYRPQPLLAVLRKTAAPARSTAPAVRNVPKAPPAYQPQPVPRVLLRKIAKSKQSQANKFVGQRVAPPLYHPQANKIVQPKGAIGPVPTKERTCAESAQQARGAMQPTLSRQKHSAADLSASARPRMNQPRDPARVRQTVVQALRSIGLPHLARPAAPQNRNVPATAVMQSRSLHTPNPRAGLIQRKVGFEFELQLPLSRYVPGEENPVDSWGNQTLEQMRKQLTADMKGEHEGFQRVRSHETVLDRWYTEGWKVTADNTSSLGTHKANLEINTRPIDTESLGPTEVLWQLNSVISSVEDWVQDVVKQNPQHNRIRLGQYVIGFPGRTIPKPPNYNPGNIKTSAYVQINIGVPLTKVTNLYGEASRSGNEFKGYEAVAVKVAKRIFTDLKQGKHCEDSDEARLVGLFTLLGAAIMGAQNVPTDTLIKKLWSVLPKCGLHQWWKLEREHLSEKLKKNLRDTQFFNFVRDDLFFPGIKVDWGAQLLGQYPSKELKRIAQSENLPIFDVLSNYTVAQYANDVLTGKRDVLIEAALQHKTTTGHGTSQLPLDQGSGHTLGVMEVRNLKDQWAFGQWRSQAAHWAKFAYEVTGRNWDTDLNREQQMERALRQGAQESYEGSLAYRQYMSHFVPEF